uniref:PiggyBac transposable element-derived protein domain-containing protein n=1 Tax=Strongyloides venezuelensis TaxID=75913 RepID=A0A0K0FCA1_STRVS
MHDDLIDKNEKPRVILDYNVGKVNVDISNHMVLYCPYIRKTMKWYLRAFFCIHTSCRCQCLEHLSAKFRFKDQNC